MMWQKTVWENVVISVAIYFIESKGIWFLDVGEICNFCLGNLSVECKVTTWWYAGVFFSSWFHRYSLCTSGV